jgi:small-conductance mechanosensitive channel
LGLSGQVKSDVAAAVYDAVNAAGMSFPFPRREIRVISDHDAVPAISSNPDVKQL